MSCPNCGFVAEPFKEWGYLDGPVWWDYCEHVQAMRECRSCSTRWWRPGLEPDWDIDGAAHEDCPACKEFAAEDERADLETKLTVAMEE